MMSLIKDAVILVALLGLSRAAFPRDPPRRLVNYKRAVDPYSYPVPSISFNEKPGKSKVIVETIKSISPPEFLPSDGYIGPIEGNAPGTTVPVGTVTYNAFEPDTTKKLSTASVTPTASTVFKKKPTGSYGGYRYGGSTGGSSTEFLSSTASPAPVRTSTVEPPTTLLPGFQYTSRVMGSTVSDATDSTVKVAGSKVKTNGYGGYSPKVTKKPSKAGQKHADSKPEETGFNGYHYDVGSLGFDTPTKLGGGGGGGGGGQGGMMGASYMRSSSPFYNFHVMLD